MLKLIGKNFLNIALGKVSDFITHGKDGAPLAADASKETPAVVGTLGITTKILLGLLLGFILYSLATVYMLPLDLRGQEVSVDKQVIVDVLMAYVGSATGATTTALITNLTRKWRAKL